ncbi:hypothetical protein [Hyalangium gracile]|uniref:hypothetical protein n=1 Tax=Hyalangium gracile TaxID=394092 RepID=UPI001CCAB0FB|nr:hypothetical protein [Hyalangium gracile]
MPRAVTNPGMRAMSAARTTPVTKKPEGPVGKRVASEASNQLLNALSVLKELVQDFRGSDRFVKAKAGIIGGWIFISLVSIIIACPSRGVQTTDLGARVTVLPNADRPQAAPSLTVSNTDEDPWEEVVFTVNGKYKAIVDRIDSGAIFTLTPKSLLSPTGPMPSDERFINAEMKTKDGKADLVKNGQPLTE